jgi:hypothetical protein
VTSELEIHFQVWLETSVFPIEIPCSKTPFEMLISGEEILQWFFPGKDVSYVQ